MTAPGPAIELRVPEGAALIDDTRAIFQEYAAQLDVDLCFQGFEQELLGRARARFRTLADGPQRRYR